MELQTLSVRNFRPFHRDHTIEISPVHGNKLTLIFGENMSGKTAIFLALQWCLYGRALGRLGEDIQVYSPAADSSNYLINALAVENRDFELRVRLDFLHGGSAWSMERVARCDGDPAEGDPFSVEPYLRIDGGPQPKQQIPELVSQVLHRDVAQFYLFDGELLSQYERWLDDPQEREVRVRQAIERTVGIAALRLYEEMEIVAEEAEGDQRRALARERRHERLVDDLNRQLDRTREIEDEIRDYETDIAKTEDEAQRVERQYGQLGDFASEQGRLEEIARQIDKAKDRLESAETGIRNLVHVRYWFPLANKAETLRSQMARDLEAVLVAPQQALRGQLLRRSLSEGRCELCGRAIDDSEALKELAGEGAWSPQNGTTDELTADQLRETVDHLRTCDQFRPSGELEQLEQLESQRLDARSEIFDLQDDARTIRAAYAQQPGGDWDVAMRDLSNLRERIGSARESRDDAFADLQRARAQAKDLQEKVNRIQSDPSVQRFARVSRFCVQAFELAIEKFREDARARVESAATEVFRHLVREPGYSGIQIDADYRVVTVGSDGNPLPLPSAGGQQLLTLSLIGGLNAAAVHEAPIVMDTPAGRLDKPNRRRILEWVHQLDKQVILMVHSGELTPQEVRDMDIEVGRAYRLEKVSPIESALTLFDFAGLGLGA